MQDPRSTSTDLEYSVWSCGTPLHQSTRVTQGEKAEVEKKITIQQISFMSKGTGCFFIFNSRGIFFSPEKHVNVRNIYFLILCKHYVSI